MNIKHLNKKTPAIIFALLFIVLFVSSARMFLGPLPAIVFFLASFGGFILWMFTTYKTPIDPLKVIVPYLLTIIFFIIHVYEEYLTDFASAIHDISGFHVLERDFLTVAAFAAPIIWLVGAILLLKRTAIGFYFLSFFYVAMIIAELSHFIFPFIENGTFHYVSGMYTAALPLVPSLYGFLVTLSEIKKERNISKGAF